MTRSKWNLRWSAAVAVVLALAIGCACWGLGGGCATPGGGGGNGNANETEEPGDGGGNGNEAEEPGDGGGTEELAISEATCEPLDDQAGGFEIRVRAVSSQGRELSYTRRVITAPQDGSFEEETEVTADGQLVMSIISSNGPVGSDGSMGARVQIEYGPLVPGVSSASAVVEEGVVSGMVDGRAIVPMPVDDEFDASAASFEDGAPGPELGMDPDLEAAVTDLFEAAAIAAEECQAPNGNDAEKVVGTGLKKDGHYSETVETTDCLECWAKCIAAGVTCAGAVTGTCWLAVFGAPACYIAGYAACIATEISCDIDCYRNGGGCCPVMCHDNYPASVCCLDGESCLNPNTGRCCGPGEKPCYNRYCCEGTEVCIYDSRLPGPECCEPENICGDSTKTCCNPGDSCTPLYLLCCPAGHPPCVDQCCDSGQVCINNNMVCCDAANVCGDRCCADGETCHAGVCCPPDKVCGSVCCDVLDSDCIPELSLCCGFDQDLCGSTCCPIGESCVDGTDCCPDVRICGGVCCDEGHGCDPETDDCMACPNATDHACAEGPWCCPEGKVCTEVEGLCCDAGEIYCCKGGCGCKPPGECIW